MKKTLYTKSIISLLSILFATLLSGCDNSQPKPRGYFRIDLKEKTYNNVYNDAKYPFTFTLPDSICRVAYKDENAKEKDGLNIVYPKLRACIYCDYKPVKDNFREISEDLRGFVYKHTAKADAITEQPYENPEAKVWGLLYELKGNSASQVQFVLTDSIHHYFRGALYFNVTPNPDSLAPVVDYINEDIIKLMESFRWK